jgi:hypothetical protein
MLFYLLYHRLARLSNRFATTRCIFDSPLQRSVVPRKARRDLLFSALDFIPAPPLSIGHLANTKTSHLANIEIPQMADVSGGFLVYAISVVVVGTSDRERGRP